MYCPKHRILMVITNNNTNKDNYIILVIRVITNSMEESLLQKLIVAQLVTKFCAF